MSTDTLRRVALWPFYSCFRATRSPRLRSALWRAIGAHTWFLEPSRADALSFWGATLSVNPRDICGRYLRYFGVWEPNLTHWIESHLQPGDTFVDVGANVGYFSLLASHIVGPGGRVVSLEPVAATFATLQHNIMNNAANNVRAVNAAAWDECTTLPMFTSREIVGTSSAVKQWADRWAMEERCDANADKLDNLLEPDELASASVVKIDVEGAEWRALQGMTGLLKNSRRDLKVVIEVAPQMLAAAGATLDDLLSFFSGFGFRPSIIENDYRAATYADGVVCAPTPFSTFPEGHEQADMIFSRS